MAEEKKNRERAEKPKYNMWQNCVYMIALSWRQKEKKVPVLCLVQAALAVGISLVNLYISPSVLGMIERKAPLADLIGMILLFAGGLMLLSAVAAYVDENVLYGRITVRGAIIEALNKKMATTSYPNLGDEKFEKLSAKANTAVSSNGEATEAVWGTLTALLKNVMGFIVYLLLLSALETWMLLVITGTSLVGFFVSTWVNGYGYPHREEVAEHEEHMWYISERARD
ncbi:MAG: ABC transporter ATP-binding protein, partial [Lachnospiraceae bacterium]|nr:ABC transporter ATP-binding protein [Lachnospiraceae bacterium]